MNKRYLTFALGLIPLVFLSCGKKYTCSHSIMYINERVAFVGHTANELSQVVLTISTAGTNFTQNVTTDTLDASGAFFRSDTAYASPDQYYPKGFFTINPGFDFKITFLSTNKQYVLTDVTAGPDSETWTQDSPCSPGSSQSRPTALRLKINGVDYVPFAPNSNNFFVYLGN